ncbi:MAG TPA: hypothetical protein VGY58_23505 [Gemmataceae bacterium]|jgi:hypothetical protein|nr:hypothetical protein [Gemmataceae bacterium]
MHDWFDAINGPRWQLLLAAGTLAWIVLVQLIRQHRARSLRRWAVALDEYAEREIARDDVSKASTAY